MTLSCLLVVVVFAFEGCDRMDVHVQQIKTNCIKWIWVCACECYHVYAMCKDGERQSGLWITAQAFLSVTAVRGDVEMRPE